jgi:hypothetical protein
VGPSDTNCGAKTPRGEPLRLVKTACGFKREHEARDAAEAEAQRLMSQAR